MGSALSKAPPAVKPRDKARAKAARDHIEPIVHQLEALGGKIEGQVLLAPAGPAAIGVEETDPSYEEEAEQYHAQRERPFYFNDANYPSAIVLAKTAEDVCETVKVISALDHSTYKLCIAGGCHSHYCMVDHTIVIDLQQLNKCTVNKDTSTISIQGGAKIQDAHAALKGTGLGFATGTNGDTGISGLTMAGGAGFLGGQAGYGCDTVVSAQVVLPSGEMVTANDDNEHADLMRALRGGGGNFGVVVEWTFKLFDVSNSFGGTVVHMAPTIPSLTKVLDKYAECLKEIPDQAGSICALPAGAPVFVNVLTAIGSDVLKEADAKYSDLPFLNKISNLGAWFRVQNDLGRKDYIDEIATLLEPVQQRTYGIALGAMVYSFDEEMRKALIHFTRTEYPKKNHGCAIIVVCLNGEMRRNDGLKSGLRHRKAEAWVIFEAAWKPQASEEDIQAVKDWGAKAKARIIELGGEDGPHNFCDTDGRRIKFFTDEQRAFLEKTKKKYDPNNLLTLNKNVVSHSE